MTLQAPDTGGLDGNSIADALTGHLRSVPGLSDVFLAAPPVRLLGGFDTLIYEFRLSDAPPPMDGALVLRLLSEPGGIRQARKEAAFQNAVADAGYPAPRVVFPGGERTIGGRVFNIMERVPGHSLMDDLFADAGRGAEIADRLAEWHARLHEIPWEPVGRTLEAGGIPRRRVMLSGQLDFLRSYVAEAGLAHLQPAVDWLIENAPATRDGVAVCHGDFHPANLMVDADGVTGVIDWSGAQLGDPEYDVAVSLVLIAVAAPGLATDVPAEMLEAFAGGYLQAYQARRPLDPERLGYYQAHRATRAFLRGWAAQTPKIDPALLPREHYPWAEPGAMSRLAEVIQETTGVGLPVPNRQPPTAQGGEEQGRGGEA